MNRLVRLNGKRQPSQALLRIKTKCNLENQYLLIYLFLKMICINQILVNFIKLLFLIDANLCLLRSQFIVFDFYTLLRVHRPL